MKTIDEVMAEINKILSENNMVLNVIHNVGLTILPELKEEKENE